MKLVKRQELVDTLRVKPIKPENIIIKKSFNEDNVEVYFEEIGHTYDYKGRKLTGITTFIKKFYKEFKVDMVAKSCAKSWGVQPQAVIDLWANNGKISSLFGTAIHNAIEYYELHKKLGRRISEAKEDEDNYALPKHPILKKIIQDFIAINPIQGAVYPEALITDTELGICGQADRVVVLDKEKKICRIGDYKINIESEVNKSDLKLPEPFSYLPPNKITKYQLQMSVYANMLEKSGWTVEGLDVYVLEDGWKYYSLPVLKVI